jgi:hypothetical protein
VTSRGRGCASQAEDVGPDRGWISHADVSALEATDRAGRGSLLTSIGQLSIASVDIVNVSDITATDGASAGADDLSSLVEALVSQTEADVYRVRLSFAGPDPRLAMRADIPLGTDAEKVVTKLRRMDARSASGPWTKTVLNLIRDQPGRRAGALAGLRGMEQARFKGDVRKLKGFGLTESLKIGYRLSPRSKAILELL